MKILYVGNFAETWTTETHIARDLQGLGHHVELFQEPPRGVEVMGPLRNAALAADLVMWTRNDDLPTSAVMLWQELRSNGIPTVGVHLDLYVGIERQHRVDWESPFWKMDHVFTPDGDPASQAWFARRGINHHWMPAACVSYECVSGEARKEFVQRGDVAFVGASAARYHRDWPWRGQLLADLQSRYGARFHRYGHGQDLVRGLDLNDLYASATVIVGDSFCPPGHQFYWSDRVYETLGRGGFLIHPRVPGLERQFTDGMHLRYYEVGDFDVLHLLIDHYLDCPGDAREIANEGQALVTNRHTYAHRMVDVLGTVFGDRLHALATPLRMDQSWAGIPHELGPIVEDDTADEVPMVREPIRLELGSGYSPTPGFVHLDINPNAPDVDIVGPVWPLDVLDGTVIELLAIDVLEHLSYWDTDAALADWARVLAPGGRLFVQVPDADGIMRQYVTRSSRLSRGLPAALPRTELAGAAWRLLGGHHDGSYALDGDDWRWNAHYSLWSQESLVLALTTAGLEVESVETNGHPNLLCWAVKP